MGKTQPASAGYQVSLLTLGSYIRVYQGVILDLTMQSSTEMPDRVETYARQRINILTFDVPHE